MLPIPRLAQDVLSQAAPLALALLERLLLTGVLLRAWGLAGFEYWSVAVAGTTILMIVEGGMMMNFGNRIAEARASGDRGLAVALYRQSNFIFLILSGIGLAAAFVLAASPALQSLLGMDPGRFADQAFIVVLALGAATALRLPFMNLFAVYRAELSIARGTFMLAGIEFVRLLALGFAVAFGASVAEAALVHFVATAAGVAAVSFLDIGRRHPTFAFAIALPRRSVLRGSLRSSLAFSLPFLPTLAITQGPVLVLGGAAALGSGAIGTFVLLRTLSNVARVTVIRVIHVLAMELSRQVIVSGEEKADALRRPIDLAAAICFGFLCGGLLFYGRTFMGLWAGREDLFEPAVLAVMLLPFVLTPSYLLSTTFLQFKNTPIVWSIGTFVHLFVASLLFAILSPLDLVLRLSVAVYLGEVIGIAAPVLWTVAGRSSARALLYEGRLFVVSAGTAVAVFAGATLLSLIIAPASAATLAAHLGLVGSAFVGLMALVGTRLARAVRAIRG